MDPKRRLETEQVQFKRFNQSKYKKKLTGGQADTGVNQGAIQKQIQSP